MNGCKDFLKYFITIKQNRFTKLTFFNFPQNIVFGTNTQFGRNLGQSYASLFHAVSYHGSV